LFAINSSNIFDSLNTEERGPCILFISFMYFIVHAAFVRIKMMMMMMMMILLSLHYYITPQAARSWDEDTAAYWLCLEVRDRKSNHEPSVASTVEPAAKEW